MHHAGQIEGTPGNFFLVDQIELVLANLFQAKLLGRFAELAAELIDVVGVGIDRACGQVSQLHVFGHAADEGIESLLVGCHGMVPRIES